MRVRARGLVATGAVRRDDGRERQRAHGVERELPPALEAEPREAALLERLDRRREARLAHRLGEPHSITHETSRPKRIANPRAEARRAP